MLRVDRTIRVDAGHQVMNTHAALLADILLEQAEISLAQAGA